MTLVRIIDAPDPDDQPYLDRRTKKHGYVYKVQDEYSGPNVLSLSSVATGEVIVVLRAHTEELQE